MQIHPGMLEKLLNEIEAYTHYTKDSLKIWGHEIDSAEPT